MIEVHPTAIVSPQAIIGEGCKIGPYSVIGPHVKLGPDNIVASHVVMEGYSTIGARNRFFQFSSIGSMPQDLKYKGEDSLLELGDDNIIREYTTLQTGTEGGGMVTRIGNNNLFMVSSHVGHDSQVGNHNVLANCVALAGHVTICNHVTLGGLSAVHQFATVGDYALLGGGGMAIIDLPPYCLAQGDRAQLGGVNIVKMERCGFSPDEIRQVKEAYRFLFYGNGVFKERLREAPAKFADLPHVMKLIDFVINSKRGIMSVRSRKRTEDSSA